VKQANKENLFASAENKKASINNLDELETRYKNKIINN